MAANEDNSVSDLDEIPLWKKELIQRRKNLSKTIGANIQMSCPSATINSSSKDLSTITSANENIIGNKLQTSLSASAIISSSSTSPTSSGGVNNINKPVISGHSHTQLHTNNITNSIVTNTNINTKTTINKYHQFATNDVEKPFQLHSSNDSEYNVVSVLDKNVEQTTIINNRVNNNNKLTATGTTTKCSFNNNQLINNSNNKKSTNLNENNININNKINTNLIQEENNKVLTTGTGTGIISTTANMVAAQEIQYENNYDDPSEELKYGPGIVSKLRCRYLSLALRQTTSKQRPSLNNMRRATSLNNLLDDDNDDDDDDDEDDINNDVDKVWNNKKNELNNGHIISKVRTPDEYISPFQKNKLDEKRSRQIQRGNDSLKRARSVEALVKYDHKAWEKDIKKELEKKSISSKISLKTTTATNKQQDNNILILEEIINGDCVSVGDLKDVKEVKDTQAPIEVTIEDKIVNARERGDPKPKKMMPFLEEKERPPPECVKTKLLIFEASANRRCRSTNNNNARGDVAAKVASFKSIISHEKPPITFPKPPLSPKKPVIKPRLTSPQHSNSNKEKPIISNIEINKTINNTGKQTHPASPLFGPPTKKLAPSELSSLNSRSMSPLTVDLNYRTSSVYNTAKIDSPTNLINSPLLLSPLLTPTTPPPTNNIKSPFRTTQITAGRPDSPLRTVPDIIQRKPIYLVDKQNVIDSPITQLSNKIKTLTIESPTTTTTAPKLTSIKTNQFDDNNETDEWDDESIDDHNDSHDDDDDDYDDHDQKLIKKPITKKALENIAKAGSTTQFKFGTITTPVQQQTISNTTTIVPNNYGTKSHLPGLQNGSNTMNQKKNITNNQVETLDINGRQIGVIRPLLAEPKLKSPTVLNNFAINLQTKIDNETNKLLQQQQNVNDTNKDLTIIDKNKLKENLVIKNLTTPLLVTTTQPPIPIQRIKENFIINEKPILTSREIEKNLINKEKNDELDGNNISGSGNVSGVGSYCISNNISNGNNLNDDNLPKWGINSLRKKQQHLNQSQQNTTMLFNFSNRKDVPDYIENDGLILRRKRELPKPGESGFVLIGDVSCETSTDPDDYWSMGPPSPCDIEFENGNVIIDGKSSIRNSKLKDSKYKIKFDDSLTSVFEYPSETSLLEEHHYENDCIAVNGKGAQLLDIVGGVGDGVSSGSSSGVSGGGVTSNQKLIGSMPLGSAPLGSYTPVKASLNTSFELGITRTQVPVTTPTPTGLNASGVEGINGGASSSSSTSIDTSIEQNGGETESLQYLKPVAWSEGTRATDLLF